MLIRPATVADADALGRLHVRTWRAAYAGQLPQSYLDAMDPVARAAQWVHILQTITPPTGTTVLVDHDDVVGFTSIGPNRADDAEPTLGEVYAIYVTPDRWGQGAGRWLMDVAVRQLRAAGFTSATLWVLDTNVQARRFYETYGWRPDGGTLVDESRGFPLHEVRYALSLTEHDHSAD